LLKNNNRVELENWSCIMTSDAKIGLLLGLVFIFIIAFVINGLPRFRSAVASNEKAGNIVDPQNDSQAIGQRERRAQDMFVWQEQLAAESAGDFQTVTQELINNQNAGFGPVEKSGSVTEVALNNVIPGNIRSTMPLTPNASVIENTATEGPAYTSEAVVPVENTRQTPAQRPEPVRPAPIKSYVVQEGDGNLSNIAKKVYGEIEGNRLVNVNRIFEVNRGVLRSADEIYVGQKLIIPPLPISTQSGTGNRSVFSNQLFERVNSVGGRTDAVRLYVVKDNDSLWTIAAEQLGNGGRYKEISKLNADIIVDEDRVSPGMRLRLPAR
jgi:nucleoid-associated protein YgaU